MAQHSKIFERIKTLMEAGDIPPTPINYEFWYRYVTRADPDLVEAVEAVQRTAGRVSRRAMENIRRELFGNSQTSELTELVDRTQSQLARVAGFVVKSEDDARSYNDRLKSGSSKISRTGDVDTQRRLLTEMADATSAMIAKTEALEAQLAQSGQEIDTLRADLESARTESRTDALTGLPNRKAFMAYLEAQGLRAAADRKPLCLLFCDIDHFKRFNDTWGHRLGDEVLRLVGQSLEQLCHGIGYPARYGGEEFVIVLPSRNLTAAAEVAERLRGFISSRTVRAKASNREVGRITLSLGLAQLRAEESLDTLIERADAALYRAKHLGRNRVCTERELGEETVMAIAS